jgi:hypothetical protein
VLLQLVRHRPYSSQVVRRRPIISKRQHDRGSGVVTKARRFKQCVIASWLDSQLRKYVGLCLFDRQDVPAGGVTLSWRPGNGACNKVRRWACHIIECRWCRLTKTPALAKTTFCLGMSLSSPLSPCSWRYGCCVSCFEAAWLRLKRSSSS